MYSPGVAQAETESISATSEPSRRRPVTTRGLPIIRFSPVVSYRRTYDPCSAASCRCIRTVTGRPSSSRREEYPNASSAALLTDTMVCERITMTGSASVWSTDCTSRKPRHIHALRRRSR